MCNQTSFFFIKDCEATSFSWTVFAFSHFNAIIVASAFIFTLQKENFLAMKVFESVSERNPKLGGFMVRKRIWLLNQHTKGRVVSFRWSYFCIECAYLSHNITKGCASENLLPSTKLDCKRRNTFRLDKTHDHAVGSVYPLCFNGKRHQTMNHYPHSCL